MIYALSLTMFATLAGFVASLLGGLIGSFPMASAFLGAIACSVIGWACAGEIDRRERAGLAK